MPERTVAETIAYLEGLLAEASPGPWESAKGVGDCPIVKDAEDKPVAVAENVALDMHHGWTMLKQQNADVLALAPAALTVLCELARAAGMIETGGPMTPEQWQARRGIAAALDAFRKLGE